jgi:hypothetical protein
VFDFTAGYSRDGPTRFLAGYAGYLQADALKQYADVYAAGATHVACWAHARRRFLAAGEAGGPAADLIGRLYGVERSLPALGSGPDADRVRRQRRQAEARPVLTGLRAWLDREGPRQLPKSPLGPAAR